MLWLNSCDYSVADIIVKGNITFKRDDNRAIDGYDKDLILKNNAAFF